LEGEAIATDAADGDAHVGQEMAELLDVGLAGGMVKRSLALGCGGSQEEVGGARDRGFR